MFERLSDNELLARHLAAAGRQDGAVWIRELFRRYYPKVVSWCLRFTGEREDACDVAQIIFARAYRNLSSFRGDSTLSSWLYAITRNECMSFLAARRSRPAPLELDEVDDLPDTGQSSPEQALERESRIRLVRELLDATLDDTEKKVFTLHYGDEVPLDAITRLLGLSNPSGAKAYIVSARRKLTRAVRLWKARDRDHALDA